VFGYVNKHLYKSNPNYYENHGIRKFGYWIQDVKKKANQELDELMMAGPAKNYIKTFNKIDVPATLFVIFCTGGIDFVGGFSYYKFIKDNLFAGGEQSSLAETSRKLGKLELSEHSGEEIHEHMFVNKTVKTPSYWKQII
jgi:hypothetical protein